MPTPKPAAAPYRVEFYSESKSMPTSRTFSYYLKVGTTYDEAMDNAVLLLNKYQPLMPLDWHCLKAVVLDDNSAIKGDGYALYFKSGEKAGTYAPTEGTDVTTMPWEVVLLQRRQSTEDPCVHTTGIISPLPKTLYDGLGKIVPDDFYTASLDDWSTALQTYVLQVTKSPGGTPLISNINEVITNFTCSEKDSGRPHFGLAGRKRVSTTI
jgi:hypothetical protein